MSNLLFLVEKEGHEAASSPQLLWRSGFAELLHLLCESKCPNRESLIRTSTVNALSAPTPAPRPLSGRLAAGLVATAIVVFGVPLRAQEAESPALRENWTISVVGGVLMYELSNDESFPLFSVRADNVLNDWVRFELETSYSRPDVQQDEDLNYDPSLPTESANLLTLTVGFQARYPLGRVEPYAGFSAGLFARYDDDSEGERFSKNTFHIPLGLRVWVSDHLGIRGEYRFREDNHGISISSTEMTFGLLWTF